MNKLRQALKRSLKGFDTTLFFPPKQQTGKKNFKGQTIQRRDFSSGGPMPNVQQIYARQRTSQEDEPRLKPRALRFKIMGYGFLFFLWYVGVTLFIMYRMRGDDLDLLQKEAKRRQKIKKQFVEDD